MKQSPNMICSRALVLTIICIWIGPTLSTTDNQSMYRLPDIHIPKHYDLRLTLDPEKDNFSGTVTIEFSTSNTTNSIFLHASPSKIINIDEILLDFVHNCYYSYPNLPTEIINITCTSPVETGPYHKLYISYSGLYEKDNYLGLYKGSYDTEEGKSFYLATQFEPTYARTAFPCFDEPRFKATFQLEVIYPKNYTVLSNGENSPSINDEFVKFPKTPSISTYLIAFSVSKFVNTSANERIAPSINIYSRENQLNHTGTAVQYTRSLVDSLGEWTGIKYSDLGINKLDLVAIPQFVFGAMENWAHITFQEADLLDEGEKTSAEDKQSIISTIAHELAHHWFGDYVTLDWWSDTWLNEGFACYFQYHIPDKVFNMDLERQFVPLVLHAALKSDGAGAFPMSSPEDEINTPSESMNKFDAISYDKGASVIRMIRNIIGVNSFQEGLQMYLKLNALQNATPKKLLDTLGAFNQNITGLTKLMHNWIFQSGYPVVSVVVNYDSNTLTVTQKEFQPSPLKKDTNSKLWNIPITYTTPKTRSPEIVWLQDDKPLQIGVDTQSWIILNLKQTGYYRVNYDKDMWHRIISALKTDEMWNIPVSNRAQLIDDAFALAKAGELSYAIVFDLASYLTRETEFEPWYAAASSLKYIMKVLDVHGDQSAVANLKVIVLSWIKVTFLNIERIAPTHLSLLTKQIIFDLKCHMGDDACLTSSEEIFNNYKKTKNIENHNRRKTALCFGLRNSKSVEEDFKTLLEIYGNSDSAIERKAILNSLGCITNKDVLKKYLNQMLWTNSSISRTDEIYVYRAIINNNQVGIEAVLEFLNDNLKDIVNRYSGLISLTELLVKPAQWIVSEEQSKQLKDILNKYNDIDGIPAISNRVNEELATNKLWFEKYRKDIESAIQSLVKNNTSTIVPSIALLILSFLIFFKV